MAEDEKKEYVTRCGRRWEHPAHAVLLFSLSGEEYIDCSGRLDWPAVSCSHCCKAHCP